MTKSRLLLSGVFLILQPAMAVVAAGDLAEVPPADLSRLTPADFADDEVNLPYDLADGILEVRYPLGRGAEKKITFAEDRISVSIRHPGLFTEQVPILAGPAGQLKPEAEGVGLLAPAKLVALRWEGAKECRIEPRPGQVGRKTVQVVHIDSRDALTYTIEFAGSPE